MNAVIYLLVSALAGVLAWRAWSRERDDPVRRDFAVLCSLASATYLCFSLFLFPGLTAARFPFAVLGAFVPVSTLQFLETFLARQGDRDPVVLRRLWALTPLVAAGYLAMDLLFYGHDAGAGLPEVVLGLLVYAGFCTALYRLWQHHQQSPYRVEKARIRYLFGFMAAAVGFSALEGSDRILNAPEIESLDIIARSVALQGNLPPVGALFTGLFLFFLYQVVTLERLLDLNEIFARVVTVAATAGLLVTVLGVGVLWVQAATGNTVQMTFHLFVSSMLFLLAYEPIRHRVEGQTATWFNLRGHQLTLALNELEEALPKQIEQGGLTQTVLDRLHASGRFPELSFYVHDTDRQVVRLAGRRGGAETPPMLTVAPKPFSEGFSRGARAYSRQHLERKNNEEASTRLSIMDGMGADLVVPMCSGDFVLGWVAMKDEEWSDGFSQEEVHRLGQVLAKAGVVMENIKGFERVKEQERLAALGTMSAGLAHEIRNPLAGIKGAAQYLQTLEVTEEEYEFLEVIATETDRLNVVVSSFLDYARQFDLDRTPNDLTALVVQVMNLVRAEGLPEGIQVIERLDTALPPIDADGDKLRQVVLNLVRNAIQALPDGGHIMISTREGVMRSRVGPSSRALEIRVADDGQGIATADQAKLFIPFYTTKPQGTGLGLPICQRIVNAHQGELAVESRPGTGAEFIVRLPLPAVVTQEGASADLESPADPAREGPQQPGES